MESPHNNRTYTEHLIRKIYYENINKFTSNYIKTLRILTLFLIDLMPSYFDVALSLPSPLE